MARITRIPYLSREYLVFPVLIGVTETTQAQAEVGIQAVQEWGNAASPSFTTAEFSQDESGSPTVQVLIGPAAAHALEIGLYKVVWRITAGAESTIVAGDRYLEIY